MALSNAVAALKIVGALAAIVPVFGPQLEALINVANELCVMADGVQSNREGFMSLAHEAAIYAAAVADSIQRSHPLLPPQALAGTSLSTDQIAPENLTSPIRAEYSGKHVEALTETLKEIESIISERRGKDAVQSKKFASGLRRTVRDTVKKESDQGMLKDLRDKLGLAVKAFSITADVQGADMLRRIVEQMEETRIFQQKEWEQRVRWEGKADERYREEVLEADKRRREDVLKYLESKLMPVHDARYNSSQAPSGCMANTRVKLLAELESWIGGDGERIYWLSGLAGTGKSTVASSLCAILAKLGLLAGSFFISRNSADRRDARFIARTLAFQLARHFPAVQEQLHTILVEHPDTLSRPVSELLTELIGDPMSKIVWSASPPLLVIDAFDECDMQGGREGGSFLPHLLAAIRRGSLPLRLFVTSRPHPSIEKMFTGTQVSNTDSYLSLKLHNIEQSIVQRDIELYLDTSFRRIARTEPELADRIWPEPSTLKTLATRAGVLFIYAATVVRYVEDPVDVPSERLRSLFTQEYPPSGLEYEMLDNLYLQVLSGCVGKETDRNSSLCVRLRMVAGSLVYLQDPLSLGSLSALLNMERAAVRRMVEGLSSLLVYDPRGPVRLFHPSFPDFIGNASRCRDLRFCVVSNEQHTLLAMRCLSVMNQHLKYDICEIRDPSLFNSEVSNLPDRLTRSIPAELAYACKHWMTHLSGSSGFHVDALLNELRVFSEKHLLHWVEALSLLRELPSALNGLPSTIDWCRTTGEAAVVMTSLLSDAERTIQEYYIPISTSALQVYHSALTSMPHCSLHKLSRSTTYHNPQVYSQRYPKWSTLLRVLENHKIAVFSVAFSRDGTLLASGSEDRSVCVWDASTGDLVATLIGHDKGVCSVAFSPDGTRLTSSSYDGTLRMWDASTGDVITTFSGHGGGVLSVIFSPDGTRLASGSDDKTVRMWEASTGDVVAIFNGHEGVAWSVAFSPDGTRLASGSSDRTVRIWDVSTGDVITTLSGHDKSVWSVAFSPDGTRLASGSSDQTVRVWDVSTSDVITTLGGHRGAVFSAVFSPCGSHIASGTSDATVCVWDVNTGGVIATLNGHSRAVRSVAFSPDGTRLASGSYDKAVHVWGVKTGDVVGTIDGHDRAVSSMAISPDETRVASGSEDSTVRIWDMNTGNFVSKLNGHNGAVWSVVFSPKGTRLASSSEDGTARVWDVNTGNTVTTLTGHSRAVRSVSFSLDETRLASGSDDRTVRVWDVNTGGVIATLNGHTDWVRSVAFSPDGTRVASSSDDTTVRVWSVNTKDVIETLNGHTDWVLQVSWSLNGSEILSYDRQGAHRTWHIKDNLTTPLHESADGPTPRGANFTFYVDQQTGWTYCTRTTDNCTKRVFWVPISRRPYESDCYIQAGARFVMGAPSGTITFVDLTDWLSTWMSA